MTQIKMFFPTQSKKEYRARNRKWISVIKQLIKTVVLNNPQKYYEFRHLKLFLVLLQSLWDLEISNSALKKQAKFLPLLDPKNVNNIFLPRKVAFYQLKQCHIPQGLCQKLQNLTSASSSALTTKHSGRYMLTVAPIIDLFIRFEACCHVTWKHLNW